MLNTEATGFTKGMARPGYFYVTPNGTVKEKFFETAYTDRDTAGSLILKLFPELVVGNGREVAAPYIKLTLAQSDEAVIPGSRFTLAAEVALPPDTHVYAPEVKGYKPVPGEGILKAPSGHPTDVRTLSFAEPPCLQPETGRIHAKCFAG